MSVIRTWTCPPATDQTVPPDVCILQPPKAWQGLPWRELVRHRDLFWILALRDIRVRYKQTMLGAAWAVLQPVVTMVVLAAVFGQLLGVAQKSPDAPYPIFLYAGLLPWTLFTACVNAGAVSLVSNAGLLQKVYFPRLILPVASMGAAVLDFLIAGLVLLGMMLWHGTPMRAELALLPMIALTVLTAAVGMGLLLSAVTVTYRDVRYVVPFVLQIWFFVTPVIVPAGELPKSLQWLNRGNPLAGCVEAFRAAALGREIDYPSWGVAAVGAVIFLLAGLIVFNRTERRFADVV